MAVLEVEKISKRFASHEVVKGVSFKVEPGEIFAFLGPNGAGKTTTIKMITGLIVPDGGTVLIDGKDTKSDSRALEQLGSVLEGNRNLYWRLTAFENLVYFNVHKGTSLKQARQVADQLLERFGLSDKRNTLVQHLSRGMQQKLSIAIAVAHNPKLLLLDEPTLGLDVNANIDVIQLMQELRDEGVAIVLTTHQLDVAQKLADRVAIIDKGNIIKESGKDALIQEFIQDDYIIELTELISQEVADSITQQFDAVVTDRSIRFSGGSAVLFQLIEHLKPLEIKMVQRLELDLTQIFLQLTGHAIDV
ncbi:ABC transporter ATP-binding protein [Pseudoalteromonas ardens]|uniref:ABC transporter domain-containing protein n=1 Tax=Pseudoalteromonas rubra TaxID=43658 RepID=A0A0L0EQI4_9GAMM|nr:ABC transporter ATP-binding protein [Pseudoalteromonas sp. R96]KNC66762.1 hypothetical protein AC626_14965 [Pseudoalteromonas rubra]MDK1314037.1 ABC transporter ATP-binding protein [Pseudoalteromonas sp. R96]